MSDKVDFVCKSELDLEAQLEVAKKNFKDIATKWTHDQIIKESQLKEIKELRKENAKLIEALEFVVSDDFGESNMVCAGYGDLKEYARKVLKELKR